MKGILSILILSLLSTNLFAQQNGTIIETNVGRSLTNYTLDEDPGNLESDGKVFVALAIKRDFTLPNASFIRFGAEIDLYWMEGVNYARYHGAFPTPNSPHVSQNKPFLVTSEFSSVTGLISLPVQFGIRYGNIESYLGPSFSYIFYENSNDKTKSGSGTPLNFHTDLNLGLSVGIAYYLAPEFALSVDFQKGFSKVEFDSFNHFGETQFNSLSIGLKFYIQDK